MGDVTELIARARAGDGQALNGLFEVLYPDLRRIAHARLGRHVRDVSMGTTSLVNECYLKFVQLSRISTDDRAHFLAYAASAMRSIIVDTVRASQAERRGGDAQHVAGDRHRLAMPRIERGLELYIHAAPFCRPAGDGKRLKPPPRRRAPGTRGRCRRPS